MDKNTIDGILDLIFDNRPYSEKKQKDQKKFLKNLKTEKFGKKYLLFLFLFILFLK